MSYTLCGCPCMCSWGLAAGPAQAWTSGRPVCGGGEPSRAPTYSINWRDFYTESCIQLNWTTQSPQIHTALSSTCPCNRSSCVPLLKFCPRVSPGSDIIISIKSSLLSCVHTLLRPFTLLLSPEQLPHLALGCSHLFLCLT